MTTRNTKSYCHRWARKATATSVRAHRHEDRLPVDTTLSVCTPNQPVEQDLEMVKDLGLDPNRDRYGFSDQGDSGGN